MDGSMLSKSGVRTIGLLTVRPTREGFSLRREDQGPIEIIPALGRLLVFFHDNPETPLTSDKIVAEVKSKDITASSLRLAVAALRKHFKGLSLTIGTYLVHDEGTYWWLPAGEDESGNDDPDESERAEARRALRFFNLSEMYRAGDLVELALGLPIFSSYEDEDGARPGVDGMIPPLKRGKILSRITDSAGLDMGPWFMVKFSDDFIYPVPSTVLKKIADVDL